MVEVKFEAGNVVHLTETRSIKPYLLATPETLEHRAILVPRRLVCDDGRILTITAWEPIVKLGSIVSVTVKAIVELEDE